MSNAQNYLALAQEAATSGAQMKQLQELAEEQDRTEKELAKAERVVATIQARWKDVAERRLPELMDEIGLSEFKTATGLNIKVNETIRASIPKPRAAEAFAWLIAHNHEALIKRTVSVSFGKGEEDAARAFTDHLKTDLHIEYGDKASVHASTLSSFVKEKLEAGEDIPQDLFGVFRQRVSKVSS